MSYHPKYCVRHSHLINGRDVVVKEIHAVIFLCLVKRLRNREICGDIIIDGEKVTLDESTIANHILDMFDLIGIESKGKKRSRHREQLAQWAVDNRLVISVNGQWQLNSEFFLEPAEVR